MTIEPIKGNKFALVSGLGAILCTGTRDRCVRQLNQLKKSHVIEATIIDESEEHHDE